MTRTKKVKIEYHGTVNNLLQGFESNRLTERQLPVARDTFTTRYREIGLFTWLWVLCEKATVRIQPVYNPIWRNIKSRLSKYSKEKLQSVRVSHNARNVLMRELSRRAGSKSLGVFRALVNCRVYRKPNYKPVIKNNGVSRYGLMPRNHKNFCPVCSEQVVNEGKILRVTQGVYLPLEHQCNSVRVYDLRGKLLEVKQL